MSTTQPIPAEQAEAEAALENAVATLWGLFDEAVNLMMLTVDTFDEAQQKGYQINVPHLRKAMGVQMRKAIKARDDVLSSVGVEPDDD